MPSSAPGHVWIYEFKARIELVLTSSSVVNKIILCDVASITCLQPSAVKAWASAFCLHNGEAIVS